MKREKTIRKKEKFEQEERENEKRKKTNIKNNVNRKGK